MQSIRIGQEIVAKSDRVLEIEGQTPFYLWKKGQVLRINGVYQDKDCPVEFMVDLDNDNWDNIPAGLMEELFELVQ